MTLTRRTWLAALTLPALARAAPGKAIDLSFCIPARHTSLGPFRVSPAEACAEAGLLALRSIDSTHCTATNVTCSNCQQTLEDIKQTCN